MIPGSEAARTRRWEAIVIWGNLALRLGLLILVLATGRWLAGDSAYYLKAAASVCAGEWGGNAFRVPLYPWYLCALSPGISEAPAWTALALPLLLQTLGVWGLGLFIYRRCQGSRFALIAATIWLYDPVLLHYSTSVMADALLALVLGALLWLLILMWGGAPGARPQRSHVIAAGVLTGLLLLSKNIAGLPAMLVIAALVGRWVRVSGWKNAVRASVLLVVIIFACLAPRFYWNKTQYGVSGLSTQGNGFLQTVAAAVEHADQKIGFYDAEIRWFTIYPEGNFPRALEVLAERPGTTLYLTAKSLARILFGHANGEWSYVFTGHWGHGPAWFKNPEATAPRAPSDVPVLVWAFGLCVTLAFTLWVYWVFTRARWTAWRSGVGLSGLDVLCALLIGYFVSAPLIFGDSRFRLPIWAILFLWSAWLCRQQPSLYGETPPRPREA